MPVDQKLQSALRLSPNQRERLAATIGVSASTIDRWANGSAEPTARHLQALRTVLHDLDDVLANDEVGRELARALGAAREIMHRHGAASSRNEALDQIALILFVHLQSLRMGYGGIAGFDGPAFLAEATSLAEREQMSSGISAKAVFNRSIGMFRQRPTFLSELLVVFEPAFRALAIVPENRRNYQFHELFVNFLSSAFHEEKEFAQYMTPREVTLFMARIGNTLLGDARKDFRVLDPSCGTAAFLTDFLEVRMAQIERREDEAKARKWLVEQAPRSLVGVDTSERMIRLAFASFAATGVVGPSLLLDNALQPNSQEAVAALTNESVDLILTNPPFGAEHSRGGHGSRGVASEIAFLERYVEWLRPGGVVLTIVPDSILTNKGEFERLRRRLLEYVDVLAVISLPPVTFAASGTTTKTSVLALKKNSGTPFPFRPTFFAVCRDVGFTVTARGSIRRRTRQGVNLLPLIADAFLNGPGVAEVGVWREISSESARWDAQYWTGPVSRDSSAISHGTEKVPVSDVADLIRESFDPRRAGPEVFDYIEISNVHGELLRVTASPTSAQDAPSRARRRVKAGDVLISTVRPERRTVGVVPPHLDGAVCSTGFAVLRPREISPYTLAAALRTPSVADQLVGVSAGVAYPVFDTAALPSIELELPGEEKIADYVRYGEALEALENLRKVIP